MKMRTLARLVVLGLTFALANTCFGGYNTGLAGYWQFDGNGNDSSGNGNNINVVGNPSYGTGLFGQALSLRNNASQYATLSSNPSAFSLASGDFTVQVWVNFKVGINGREQTLLEKWSGQSGPGWTLTTPGGTGIQFYAGGIGAINSSPISFTTGAWHQVIVERSGNQFSMYYDDQVVASLTSAAALTVSSNPLLFGKRDDQDGRDFALNGSLDEVGIWNRALSSSEIAGLYNGGQGLNINPSAVPEPSSLTLCGIASLIGVILARRRKKRAT